MLQHFDRSRRLLAGVVVVGALVASGVVTASVGSPGPGATESTVVTVEPTRVLDTRYNIGVTGKIVAGTSKNLMVTGTITTWIEANKKSISRVVVPAGATGVLLNVTAVSPTGAGYLSIRPGNATGVPATAGLNFAPGDVVANAITVAVPTAGANAGQIDLYYGTPVAGATMDVVADIVGYTTNTGLLDLVNRVTALETQGVAGPAGPAGAPGTNGTSGVKGDAGPLTSSCSATLRWDLPACQTATVNVGDGPVGVAFDGTYIWVANTVSGSVSKIDPVTGTVIGTPIGVGAGPFGVAFDGTNIWVTNYGSGSVSKIDRVTGTVIGFPIGVGTSPRGVAFDGTNIWVANTGSGSVSKINPANNAVTTPITGLISPEGVAFDGTNIWVTNTGSTGVSKINPVTGTVTATVNVGQFSRGVAFDGTNIWVTNPVSDTVFKIVPF